MFYFLLTITNVKTLQDRMIAARVFRGLSQAELAAAVGCSQSTIGNIESGYRKSMRNVTAAARALNVSAEWLSEGRGSGPFELVASVATEAADTVEAVPVADVSPQVEAVVVQINDAGHDLPTIRPEVDAWTAEVLRIMATLTAEQKAAAVARLREFVGYLGPPRVGQALQVAG